MVLLHSATVPTLPPLHGQVALGLSAADRSLLPKQQKQQRFMHAIGCQTDVSEVADLRELQHQLASVRGELGSVNSELHHAERRLRLEVREEMEQRMHVFERRTKEKVAFLKKRQEASLQTMRKALRSHLVSAKAEQEAELRAEAAALRSADDNELVELRSEVSRQALLITGYTAEIDDLKRKLERVQAQMQANATASGGARRGTSDVEAKLEAQLASRDATIKALREQLSKMQSPSAVTSGAKVKG